MAADGAGAGKARRVARTMGIGRMSAGQVSRMYSSLDESVADLQERDPSDVTYPYIRLDATCIECGDAGRVRSAAPATAIGAGSGGYGRLPGLDAIGTEPHGGWRSSPLSPRARGVDGAICATGDAREGLERAIREVFPGAAPGIPKAVSAERDPEPAREPCQLATAQIEGFCPKAAEVPEETEADAPAYLDFPYEHHAGPRADNVQERADRELKRRGRVVQVFPGRKPLIRMVGAVFSEMDEDRAGRSRFGDDSIGRAVEGARVNGHAHAYEGTAAEHTARIIALVVADNPIPGRKAAWHALE